MRRHPTTVRSSLTAVVISFALVTSACSGTDPSADGPGSSPTAQPQDERPDLRRYYDQVLSFSSCEGYGTSAAENEAYVDPFECARLEVPMSYDDPGGETMQVAVLRLPAQGGAGQRIGSLVINPGGPGGSGMKEAVQVSDTFAASPVVQQLDVVGFDPRGVGSSTPAIGCFTDEERDRGEDQTTLLASSGEWSEDDTRGLADRCAEGSGGERVLAAVGTRNVARDMDVLRAAPGDEKLTYAGQSYGTRLGAVYAEMFPDNVRAMVLDGVTEPTLENPARRLTQQAGFQNIFDQLAASCAASADCPLGTDPARATTVFQDLVQPLIDEPIPAGGGRTLNFNQATGGVTAGLYFAEAWPTIIKGIARLKEGDGSLLLAIYDQFGGRDTSGAWDNFLEANLAINCNDEVRRSPEQEAQLRADIAETSPFLATGDGARGSAATRASSGPASPASASPTPSTSKDCPARSSSPSPTIPRPPTKPARSWLTHWVARCSPSRGRGTPSPRTG